MQTTFIGVRLHFMWLVIKMEGESPREGFDEPEDEHLLSKERDRQRETDLYFKIPEAKPLLSKSTIDQRKPKILIRSIKIDL